MSPAVLAICQVVAMALWFSATAVVPAPRESHALGSFAEALFTSNVQAGFIAALIGAAANALILGLDPAPPWAAVPRFITGMYMAGI